MQPQGELSGTTLENLVVAKFMDIINIKALNFLFDLVIEQELLSTPNQSSTSTSLQSWKIFQRRTIE